MFYMKGKKMIKNVTNSYSVGAVSGFSTKETGKGSLKDLMVSGTLFEETESDDYEVDLDNIPEYSTNYKQPSPKNQLKGVPASIFEPCRDLSSKGWPEPITSDDIFDNLGKSPIADLFKTTGPNGVTGIDMAMVVALGGEIDFGTGLFTIDIMTLAKNIQSKLDKDGDGKVSDQELANFKNSAEYKKAAEEYKKQWEEEYNRRS